jgi:hypothetical protein
VVLAITFSGKLYLQCDDDDAHIQFHK